MNSSAPSLLGATERQVGNRVVLVVRWSGRETEEKEEGNKKGKGDRQIDGGRVGKKGRTDKQTNKQK